MKKILFFITSLAGGGAEKVLVNLVNNLNKTKYDVTVLSLFDVGVNKKYLMPQVKYKYVFKKVIRGNIHLFKLFSPEFLYRSFIKEDYDIAVSFFQGATTRIIAGCNNKNTKLVQWVHNEFHTKDKITRVYRNEKECIKLQKRFDANVYVANTVKEIYLKTFPELNNDETRNIVLYNVVESDKIREKAKEQITEFKNDEINLINVGRLVPQKSFDRLLEIMARLKKESDKEFHLYILGDGELKGNLTELCNSLGLQNEVTFLGYNENPYKYVKNADLFVCSSLHEGFSTAVTESLIVGTPVITTLCSGMEELLGDNEYGVITENDADALHSALLEFLNNKEKLSYYKQKALERGRLFDKSETTARAQKLFDELLG